MVQTRREEWERIVNSSTFDAACDAALIELVLEQPTVGTPDKGWDSHSQVLGARRILEILTKLHLKEEPVKTERMRNLPPPS